MWPRVAGVTLALGDVTWVQHPVRVGVFSFVPFGFSLDSIRPSSAHSFMVVGAPANSFLRYLSLRFHIRGNSTTGASCLQTVFDQHHLVKDGSGLCWDTPLSPLPFLRLIRVTPASSPIWIGPKMENTLCPIRATMRSFTVSKKSFFFKYVHSGAAVCRQLLWLCFVSLQGT